MSIFRSIVNKFHGEKLIAEVARGDIAKIKSILSKENTDPSYQNSVGNTALHYTKYLPTVRSLIKYGANINCTNNDNATPLQWHIHLGNEPVALSLIREGAEVNIKDENGNAPLHVAAGDSDYKRARIIVRELLENGADADK